MNTFTTYYLGESIQLVQSQSGWCAWWLHPMMGNFGDGLTHPSIETAIAAVMDLIRRDGAVDALLEVIDDWKTRWLLNGDEHSEVEASLLEFVIR